MFATTKFFLDYFGLKKLEDLPPLADLSDWESLRVQLNLPEVEEDVGEEMPAIPELPVLYRQIESEDPSAVTDEAAGGEDDTDEADLIASEWSDPVEKEG